MSIGSEARPEGTVFALAAICMGGVRIPGLTGRRARRIILAKQMRPKGHVEEADDA